MATISEKTKILVYRFYRLYMKWSNYFTFMYSIPDLEYPILALNLAKTICTVKNAKDWKQHLSAPLYFHFSAIMWEKIVKIRNQCCLVFLQRAMDDQKSNATFNCSFNQGTIHILHYQFFEIYDPSSRLSIIFWKVFFFCWRKKSPSRHHLTNTPLALSSNVTDLWTPLPLPTCVTVWTFSLLE